MIMSLSPQDLLHNEPGPGSLAELSSVFNSCYNIIYSIFMTLRFWSGFVRFSCFALSLDFRAMVEITLIGTSKNRKT
jgi:hypothetical protein